MMIWRDGIVSEIIKSWPGAVEVLVTVTDNHSASNIVKALAYPEITGEILPGDRVLLTGSAVARGLGTGGYYLIAGIPDRLPSDSELTGHLMKARYTPLQFMVQGVDEQDTEFHELLAEADDLAGLPIVCADLHSALPAIVAGIKAINKKARIAYVMTDGGALPAWFSRTAAELKERNSIIGTITAGQSFGGDLEAV
ncbi:MAG: DUF3866 family protein, partial [Arcanobacterium sp.]|nr:DUF3866 family protein [Arcanobacterium sp.]